MMRKEPDRAYKFIEFIKNNTNYDFEFLIDNQSALFSKEHAILKWSNLSNLIDKSSDLRTRYKTLDGKLYDMVKNINDDVLFVHINISASTCMRRIANIMNKFNMSDNSVEIVLK
jgi:hypothetical protein